MPYKELKNCLVCDNQNLSTYLDLGEQPLANTYPEQPAELPKYPLKVNFCLNCSHSQLSHAVDPKLLFSNYLYVSGTTETLKRHFQELAFWAKLVWKRQSIELHKAVVSLEIGGNDGSLAQEFKYIGCLTTVVDPAENLKHLVESKNIEVKTDFFSYEFAKQWKRKFSIITALNVVAHNPNPKDFLLGCKEALEDDGILIIEFPYNRSVIKSLDFGQVYLEHFSYWSVKSFKTLCDKVGLIISDIKYFSKIHGGTIRFTLTKNSKIPQTSDVSAYLTDEYLEYMHNFSTFLNYV